MLTQSQKKDVPSPSQQKEQNARPVRDDIGYSRGGSGEDVGSGPLWSPVVPSSQDVGERPSRLPVVLPAIPRANQSTHGTNAQLHPLHSPVVSYSEAPHSPINPVYSLKAEQPEENIPANDTASASSRPLTNVSVSTSPTNLIPNDENSQPKQTNSKPSKPSTSPLPSPVASKDYKENTLTDSVRNDVAHPHPDVDTMREERTHERDQSLPTSPAIITPKDVGADVSRPQADTPGEPLSQRAQQFLRPIVDIDPTNVRIHRDAQAAQFATAHQADAVTTGNEIMLAAGHAEDTPQTLALLAHEMTHVARKRELRFVPPIVNTPTNIDPHVDRIPARGTPTMTNAEKPSRAIVEASLAVVLPVSSAPHTQKPIATNIVEAADEERLALQVEQQAFYYAQQQTQQPIQAQEPQYRAGVDQQDQPTSVTNELVMPVARSSNAVDNWGGLPAPWEPLPNWLTTASTPEGYNTATAAPLAMPPMPSVQTQTAQVQFNAPMPSPAVNGNGHVDIATGSISTDGSAAGDVQRAGVERSMNTAQQIGPVQQMTGAAPAPDLDDLARQVYTVLKRRLGVEHRRL